MNSSTQSRPPRQESRTSLLVSNHVLGRAKKTGRNSGLETRSPDYSPLEFGIAASVFFLEMEDSVTKMTKRKHIWW